MAGVAVWEVGQGSECFPMLWYKEEEEDVMVDFIDGVLRSVKKTM